MAHIPVVYVPPPWEAGSLVLDDRQQRHLIRVLRVRAGEPVEYTDGAGNMGHGVVDGERVIRGSERAVARSKTVAVYLAVPKARERQRFAIEKLVELGVASIGWLETAYGEGRAPRPDKMTSWAISALEQSRGAWLPTLYESVGIADVLRDHPAVVAADRGGLWDVGGQSEVAILVGPEAGWKDAELPDSVVRLALADTILRTETAAVVGAARLMYS